MRMMMMMTTRTNSDENRDGTGQTTAPGLANSSSRRRRQQLQPTKPYANRVARVMRMSRHDNTPLIILLLEHEQTTRDTARLADELDELQVLERRLRERLYYVERRILRAERHLWHAHNAVQRAGHRDDEANRTYRRLGQNVAREFERQKLTAVELEAARRRAGQVTEALDANRRRLRGLTDDVDAWLDEREAQLEAGGGGDGGDADDPVNELAFVETVIEQMVVP